MSLKPSDRSAIAPLLTLLGVLLLAGCGNFYDSLSLGEWREVGSAQPPDPVPEQKLVITPLAQGSSARTVQPGDLVKASVTVTITGQGGQEHRQEPKTIWIWTGREPGPRTYDELIAWGDLGSPEFRRALVGKMAGDRFQIMSSSEATGLVNSPLNGFIAVHGFTLNLHGGYLGDRLWPELLISRRGKVMGPVWSEIELMDICKAKLLRRSATQRQWGFVPNILGASYDTWRKGTITWSALEADCGAPQGKMRFEIGPLYRYERGQSPGLLNWSDSYRSLRPAHKYPHEYGLKN